MLFIKTLVRSSLDNYVLPGTLSGTEILLLYMTQWKRQFVVVTFGTVYLIFSQIEIPKFDKVLTEAHSAAAETE